ncbi:ABC transporter permease [Paenibacillus wulumuqiensis]|uniref:ABC transporter permease n=1 Tax=Paenibacillus wulumuqiensis TaxID=1567107 RepID=UPI000619DCE5|nr:ABC transporter permease [Paenibacillus wulumuqiensis]
MSRLSVWHVFLEEWRQMVRDRKLLVILLLTPILYSVLFGFLYSHERITEMAVVVYDGDNSQLSRQIIQAFDATDTFAVKGQVWNEEEVTLEVQSGEAKVGIVIPDNFAARLKHGENVPVLTLIDGSNMMYSNSASRIANQVISSVSAGASLQTLEQKGMNSDQASSVLSTIPFRSRVLFNPVYNYKLFMPLGVIAAALQQCLLLGIALSCTRDKEQGTWARFAAWRLTPWRLAIAKLLPYFLAGMFNVVTTFGISCIAFHIPFHGAVLPLIVVSIAFNFALCGLGFVFSLFSKSRLDATQTLMLIAVPSFMLSGYTWPLEAMPAPLRMIGECLPLTYFLEAVRNITLKGLGWTHVWHDVMALGVIGMVGLLLSFLLYPFVFRQHAAEETPSEAGAELPVKG